jgi:sortase A
MAWVRRVERFFLSRRDLARFSEAAARARARVTALPALPVPAASSSPLAAAEIPPAPPARLVVDDTPPDQSLWSKERVRGYAESLREKSSDPLAVLRIPKISLEVAVLDGTDDLTLNRAVGHIANTPKPGENGNVGIAGHRDGFFRGLKDVVVGDTMELETTSGRETYRVEDIWIVNPEDVRVLDPTAGRAITLVACYPFYFVGSAPKRYIVRAVPEAPATASRVP